MKALQKLFSVLIILFFTSCQPANLTPTQATTATQNILTSTTVSIPTATLTPPVTLAPTQSSNLIKSLLKEPNNCSTPCFWGIVPDKTSIGEAKNIITHLGLQADNFKNQHGWELYAIKYEFDNKLSISTVLEVQEGLVKGLVININPEFQIPNVAREWLAYSPETLIAQYGEPSFVEFYLSIGPSDGTTLYILDYGMTMYFDLYDLTVQYHSEKIKYEEIIKVCPLTDHYEGVRVWLGKNPAHVPRKQDVSLEYATNLNLEQFTNLMLQEPENACLNLSRETFFP